LSRYSLLFR